MAEINFVLKATDEATPVIERVRQQLNRFNDSYSARMGRGGSPSGSGGGGGKPTSGPSVSSPFGRGVLGGLASLTIAGMGIKAVLGKISQTLIQASPYLQAVTNEMKTAIMLYIRPYGDKLAKLLKPMSEAMIEDAEKSTEWNEANPDAWPWEDPTLPGNKNRRELLKRLGGNMGNMSMSATGGASYEGDLSTEGAPDSSWAWENIISPLSGFGDWLMNNISQGIGDLSTKLGGFGDWLYDGMTGWWDDGEDSALSGFASWLLGKITSPFNNLGETLGGFGSWLDQHIKDPLSGGGESLGGLGGWLWEKITGGIGDVGKALGGFGSWLWNGITGGIGTLGTSLGGFGSWLYNSITGALSGAWSTLSTIGSTLYTSISSALGNIGYEAYRALHNAIASLLNSIANIELPLVGKPFKGLLGTIPMLAVGGSVLRTGAAIVHEGENVLTKQQSQMMANGWMGMMSAPQVNIYGNVYGVNDLERTIDEAIARSQLGYSGYR